MLELGFVIIANNEIGTNVLELFHNSMFFIFAFVWWPTAGWPVAKHRLYERCVMRDKNLLLAAHVHDEMLLCMYAPKGRYWRDRQVGSWWRQGCAPLLFWARAANRVEIRNRRLTRQGAINVWTGRCMWLKTWLVAQMSWTGRHWAVWRTSMNHSSTETLKWNGRI